MALTAPNVLTLFRVATAPLLVYLLLHTGPVAAALAAAVFLLATLSDYFDGYLARSYGTATTLGKFLDPLADKLIVAAALIMLAGEPTLQRVPAWLVVVIVWRELMVTGLRAVAAGEGVVIGASDLGNYKMVLQAIAIQGLLVRYTYFGVNFFAAGMFVLWIATAVSLWSGVDYYVRTIAVLTAKEAVRPAAEARFDKLRSAG